MTSPKEIKYKFYFRPGYGSEKMLLEIFDGAEKEEFIPDLLDALKDFNPKVESTLDLWMNDEVQLSVTSELGKFTLSKDTWGFAFVWNDADQEVVKKVSDLLASDDRFEKVAVDFDKYK